MGCLPFRVLFGRADDRRRSKIRAIADTCSQNILPAIRQFLAANLDTCVRDVRSNLAPAQAVLILSRDHPFSRLEMADLCALLATLKQEREELRELRSDIGESLGWSKWWRSVFNFVFTVSTIGAILGSVVFAAFVTIPVAVTIGTVSVAIVKAMEQWIRSIWEEHKDALEEEQKVMEKMQYALQVRSSLSNYYLEALPSLVEKVKSDYAALATYKEYDLHQDVGNDYEEEEAIEKKINELKEGMDLLISTSYGCTQQIVQAEAVLSLINNNA